MNEKKRNLPPDSELDDLLQCGFRYALSLTHNATRAEELLQEACLKMVKSEKSWQKDYLFAVIRNTFIDIYRRSKRYPMESLTLIDGKEMDYLPAETRNDEEIFAETGALDHALSELRADEREAVMPRLGFSSTIPAEVEKLHLEFTGARYCSIQGNLAVQIKMKDRLGSNFTLYQTPSVEPLTRLPTADFRYAGLQMKLWQERGLFMGLACVEEMNDMDG